MVVSKPRVIFLLVVAVFIAAFGANSTPPPVSANLIPVLNVTPKLAIPNQVVTLFGTGFTPAVVVNGELLSPTHQITGVGLSVISIDGEPLRAPDVIYPVNFDTTGSWAASITVPLTLGTVAGNQLVITAEDDLGVSQTTVLDFKTPVIRADPETGSRNSDLIISGLGFPSSNTATAPNVEVSIIYAGIELGVITPNYFGELDAIFEVPAVANTPSTNIVQARIIGYNRIAVATHSVPGASIIASPSAARPGSVITITASDFPAIRTVTSIRVGNTTVSTSPAPITSRNGDFISSFIMPLLSAGAHTITATADGISAVVPFTVTEGEVVVDQVLPTPVPTLTAAPINALENLSQDDNLVRVWTFNNADKSWAFYDPRPAFAKANSIKTMEAGSVYWIRLNNVQTTALNGKSRVLFSGWNLLPW